MGRWMLRPHVQHHLFGSQQRQVRPFACQRPECFDGVFVYWRHDQGCGFSPDGSPIGV